MQERLLVREWVAVLLLSSFLLSLSLYTLVFNASRSASYKKVASVSLQTVFVTGAVAKPGYYSLPKEQLIASALSQAEILPEADLSGRLCLKKEKQGQVLRVPFNDWIEVYVEGEIVDKGWKRLPKKTRICDISKYLNLTDQVDPHFLQRKRIVRDGEHLSIPKAKK